MFAIKSMTTIILAEYNCLLIQGYGKLVHVSTIG